MLPGEGDLGAINDPEREQLMTQSSQHLHRVPLQGTNLILSCLEVWAVQR